MKGYSLNSIREYLNKYNDIENRYEPENGVIMDGTDDYYSIPNNDNLNFGIGDFSVEAYCKAGEISGSKRLLYSRSGSTGVYNGFNFKLCDSSYSNKILFKLYNGSLQYALTSTNPATEGNIYYIIAIKTATLLKLYINGELDNTLTIPSGVDVSPSSLLYLFGATEEYFDSNVYLARIFNKALTEDEIKLLWNNGKPDKSELPYYLKDASNEKVLNGIFDTDLSNWGKNSGSTWNWETGGYAKATGNSGDNNLYQNIYGVNYGAECELTFETVSCNLDGDFKIWGNTIYLLPNTISTDDAGNSLKDIGTHTITFTAQGGYALLFVVTSSNTTGSIKIDNVSLKVKGSVLELKGKDAGTNGWVGKLGGEVVIANSAGQPTVMQGYRDGKSGINTDTTLANTQKANTILKGVWITNADTLNSYNFSLGTTSTATELINAEIVSANTTIFKKVNSASTITRSLYTKVSGGSFDIVLVYENI